VTEFPEPGSTDDLRGLLLDYLDFFRTTVAAKLDGLSPENLAGSTVPSGWTPAGLVNHLVNVERRWLEWGFLAEHVRDPWRDADEAGGWVTPDASVAELRQLLDGAGLRSRAIVEAHALTDVSATGGRFDGSTPPPQLQSILLHLVQEYARHAGHLDIARELADGLTGEAG
jgi:uncharacterized damage-inducible protein DinB